MEKIRMPDLEDGAYYIARDWSLASSSHRVPDWEIVQVSWPDADSYPEVRSISSRGEYESTTGWEFGERVETPENVYGSMSPLQVAAHEIRCIARNCGNAPIENALLMVADKVGRPLLAMKQKRTEGERVLIPGVINKCKCCRRLVYQVQIETDRGIKIFDMLTENLLSVEPEPPNEVR